MSQPSARSKIFGHLHPVNPAACEAFDAVVNATIEEPIKLSNVSRYLNYNRTKDEARSIFLEDERKPDELQFSKASYWTGSFTLNLENLPKDPSKGWYLGVDGEQSLEEGTDILLAPPTGDWSKLKIAGRHARLYLHKESCRIVLEARHRVTIAGNRAKTVKDLDMHVIKQEDIISIGNFVYTFEYTDYFTSTQFKEELCSFMETHREPRWSVNKNILPASVGTPMMLGDYLCSARCFAQGTFGKVSAGWTRKGTAVAIKTFKRPKEDDMKMHQDIMSRIGCHVRCSRYI